MKNSRYNPMALGNAEHLANIIVSLLPESPTSTLSPEELKAQKQSREESHAKWVAARYGELPAGTYRILEQGGFVGWHLELEIDGEVVILKAPDANQYAIYADRPRAMALARAEIARRHGQAAADAAQFKIMWGGEL